MKTVWKCLLALLFLIAAVLFVVANMSDVPNDQRTMAKWCAFALLGVLAVILLLKEKRDQKRRARYMDAFRKHESLGEKTGWLAPGVLLVADTEAMTEQPDPRGLQWVVINSGVTRLGYGVIPDTVAELFLPETVTDIAEGAVQGSQTIIRTLAGSEAQNYARRHSLPCEAV